MLARVVEFCGHEPVVETDSLLACATHGRPGSDIAAVLSDLMMPRLDGLEVLAIFSEQVPSARRIIVTAAPRESRLQGAVREGLVQHIVSKPPTIDDVVLSLAWLAGAGPR
jgi:CheY-like chemotaxis protein